jgi:hypothetical protein
MYNYHILPNIDIYKVKILSPLFILYDFDFHLLKVDVQVCKFLILLILTTEIWSVLYYINKGR